MSDGESSGGVQPIFENLWHGAVLAQLSAEGDDRRIGIVLGEGVCGDRADNREVDESADFFDTWGEVSLGDGGAGARGARR